MPNKGIAIFDFCGTLANFQTADRFVMFTLEHFGNRMSGIRFKCSSLFRKQRVETLFSKMVPGFQSRKSSLVYCLRGLSEESVNEAAKEYYNRIVKPNLIPETISELKHLKEDGIEVHIVSAGYFSYIRYFAKDFGIPEENIIATTIEFRNGRCSGCFGGKDCTGSTKVKECVAAGLGNRRPIVAFSDSRSDLPIMLWADRAIIVKEAQSNNQFVDHPEFKTIVWHL